MRAPVGIPDVTRVDSPVARWTPLARAVLTAAIVVTVMTAPTLTHLTSVGRLDGNDGRFSIWNVAWIDHALLTSPGELFNANIFWPHQGALAYSELNLVAGALGLPWYAATGKALAALNGSVWTALVLAFVCTWALVRRLSGSDGAGYVAAVAFVFCPFMSARTPHIQLLMVFVFPLAMLAFHRLVARPTLGAGVALGGAVALAGLACGYYGVFVAGAVGLMAALFVQRAHAYWVALFAAVVTAAVVIAPVYWRFMQARAASGAAVAARDAGIDAWSANLSAYLASSAAAHEWWAPALWRWSPWNEVLFPGVGVILLAGIGVAALRRAPEHRRVVWSYVALAALTVWASCGPRAGLYRLLAPIPGMSLLRAPARMGILVTFALAVIAGFGVARLERRWRWAPVLLAILLACELGVHTKEWGWPSWPLKLEPAVSPAYTRLAQLPRGVLVEFPFPYVRTNYHNHAPAMYWSTYHWLPLVNGYSDLTPPDFDAIALPINAFPDPASFAIMKSRSVRYVLWHIDTYDAASLRNLTSRFDPYGAVLRPILKSDDVWLYEITGWP